jgi:hypothetical protein
MSIINRELDQFAQTIYSAYSSFRVAGFEEAKAFRLANTFMVTVMNNQAKADQEKKEDD